MNVTVEELESLFATHTAAPAYPQVDANMDRLTGMVDGMKHFVQHSAGIDGVEVPSLRSDADTPVRGDPRLRQ
jgi:hypothetical protein